MPDNGNHQTYAADAWARVRGALAGLTYTADPRCLSTSTVVDSATLEAWAERYQHVVEMRHIEAGVTQ
ncbi:hypothetical protein SEA_LILBEANIE_81 [Gordonia phage Lilbeanie]|uniref:Uncharacterized protein n=1 Tax=Gordonia phage Lilbeanie TaxID=2794947 RepID=A0A7T1KSC1_9CAUD|nr:hypothetical protein J1773_gp81 [Gordonia phage Lilbeanie]QPO17159.1 hypothetical protein SEA_LILBEANIE_81 [Gordonia phage Lilbeanie]